MGRIIPLIIRWPGHVDAGRQDDRFASTIDLLPTFLACAGLECPKEVQGVNLLPYLTDDGKGGLIRFAAYSEYGVPGMPYNETRLGEDNLENKIFTNPGNPKLPWEGNPVSLAGRIRMIRTKKWKFIEEIGGTCELYDLENDPFELVNLWNRPEYAEVQSYLAEKLHDWKSRLPGIEYDYETII